MTIKGKIIDKIRVSKIISSPYFEARPRPYGMQIVIVGAVGISEVDEGGVLVKCHGVKLRISGKRIKINVLEHNTLEVVGRVEGINIINASN
jgi:hypothetical protein